MLFSKQALLRFTCTLLLSISFALTAGAQTEASPTESPATETPIVEPSVPKTSCTEKFLAKESNIQLEAVCARTIDDALSTEVRVGQATSRIVGLSFSNLEVQNERRCDCEFAFGRYDITPRAGWTDKHGWKRWACKKFVTKDGTYCGQKWFKSDEGFKPFICDPTEPGQEKCIAGTFVSWLRNPDTNIKQLVPVTACARKDQRPNENGTPSKDVLVLVVDADAIPAHKKHVNGCINVEIRKDLSTKEISFFGVAPEHPLPDVQTQPLLRGVIKKKTSN